MQRRHFIQALGALALLSSMRALRAQANSQVVTDIAGRQVTLRYPLRRIFLAEGNLFYTVAALNPAAPSEKLIGWRDNFRTADLDSYQLYCRYFPELAQLPTFAGVQQMQFNLEGLIALRPEVMVLNLNTRLAVEGNGLMNRLTAAGIPVVFVDMSIDLIRNSARSLAIMGQLFDRPQRAASLIRFRQRQLDHIANTLAKHKPTRPRIMMERAAGLYDDCCLSWGNGNYGEMVDCAGGVNVAGEHIHSVYGALSQEMVIASHPDKIVVTGSNWSQYSPNGDWVNLGPGADLALAQQRLRALMQRPAYRTLHAAFSGQAYAIWHPFYDHPFNFVAIERLAAWFHPELFHALNPEATLAELFTRYLPIPYQPGYWVALNSAAATSTDTPVNT
ncbi:ABC transporter substrate-binding protein [Serratia sp. NPDC078593]|uniref:ABC transporter substrate-binding protein n=1 Tax=unclassified Serratia (in: enterobacteria) TaxID=2647522 RepID=UPI0037D4EFE7